MSESSADLSNLSMMELFRMEVEDQAALLTDSLLALDQDPTLTDRIAGMMRAAHSLKGAARLVNCPKAVRVAHAMEDSLAATQKGDILFTQSHLNELLRGVDILSRIANSSDPTSNSLEIEAQSLVDSLASEREEARSRAIGGKTMIVGQPEESTVQPKEIAIPLEELAVHPINEGNGRVAPGDVRVAPLEARDRVVRVSAENMNRLLGLAGESVVGSRWLDSFTNGLTRLKHLQKEVNQALNELRSAMPEAARDERIEAHLTDLQHKLDRYTRSLGDRQAEAESFNLRSLHLATTLYEEVLDCRMRPFSDCIRGLQRMVRDVALSLGKQVKLEIIGETTPVDRDILDRLEAPLTHLLRNAVDHGIEAPAERRRLGKPDCGTIRLEAVHTSGMLKITVSDDGCGIEPEALRAAIVAKKLTTREMAGKMADSELFEFLFLPRFTMKETVSEISGRGVGLDAVHEMVRQVDGAIEISSKPGLFTRFHLRLPLTISVIRTILVEVSGEPYAFPLGRVSKVIKLPVEKVESLEGRQHFSCDGQQVALVAVSHVLRLEGATRSSGDLSVLVVGDGNDRFGLVVDRLLGEFDLAVRALDPRLGKIKDISSAAVMPDRTPVLIIDVHDLILSIKSSNDAGRHLDTATGLFAGAGPKAAKKGKKVLVVDDSLTVRELERKLLDGKGYDVEVAVDGMHGWNSVRTGNFDLVITDVDMPRLDGIELVTLIKKDPKLKSLPVIIVSYKDREEDHQRGLEAGADYYLTKGSFHDDTFLVAVADLIGEPVC
ncbi:MAG TPA: hybrid sensor histidine kinase/response regulator [Blastocatellia bacterium]|nr:hybrid sensor histidine kinase/response regulator [Blastocatellia bacterium]